ncbi:MAG: hypothetical protein ACKO6N_13295 [Myxococcota bacterium]
MRTHAGPLNRLAAETAPTWTHRSTGSSSHKRSVPFLALLSCSALLGSTPALALDASELLANHKKALGGDANLAKLTMYAADGTVTQGGSTLPFTWAVLTPQSVRQEVKAGELTETTVLVGSEGWGRAFNGVTRKLSGPQLEAQQLLSLVASHAYLRPEEVELEYGEVETTADKKWKVQLSGRKTSRLTLTFDAGTALLAKVETDGKSGRCELAVEDYRKVGSLKLPHKFTRTCQFPGGKAESRFELKKLDPKASIDETVFERSGDAFGRLKFPAGQDTVKPNLKYDPARHLPLVETSVGGKTYTFLLDTRLPFSVVDNSLVTGLGLKPVAQALDPLTGASLNLLSLENLTLAGAVLARTPVIAGDVKALVPGLEVAGVLGQELLEHAAVELDFGRLQLVLHNPATFTDTGAAESMRLDDSGRINVLINGQSLLSARLATGFAGTLGLPQTVLDQEKLLPASRLPVSKLDLEGLGSGEVGLLASVQLGNLAINQVPVGFNPETARLEEPVLGNQLLERVKLTFDVSRQQVLIEPGVKLNDAWPYDRSGLTLKGGPTLQVESASAPAPTALMVGDVIVQAQVEGAWVKDASAIRKALTQAAGTRIKLKIKRRGKDLERELELKEPF